MNLLNSCYSFFFFAEMNSCYSKSDVLVELYLLSIEWFKYAKCFIGMLKCNGFDVAKKSI